MTHRPTAKQEASALAYFRLRNATAAYREACAPKTMSDKTINEAASRLLKNSKVAARISELTAPALKSAGLIVGRLLQEVARISYSDPRRLCRETAR
jgi:phage terminase small subunit